MRRLRVTLRDGGARRLLLWADWQLHHARKHRVRSIPWRTRAGPVVGAVVCVLAAAAMVAVSSGSPWEKYAPLFFCAVPLLVSLKFGSRAGVSGTILGGVVFLLSMFHPLSSFPQANEAVRANVAWMFLFGISLSFFGPAEC